MNQRGSALAADHYYLQLTGNAVIPCAAPGLSGLCASRFVWEFGYMSIPLMSFTVFALLFLLALAGRRYNSNSIIS